MPARRIRVDPATAMREGFEAVRREAGVPEAFPPEVQAEAEAAAGRALERERIDVPFVTIDPPGARDLDQALHIEPLGEGHRVRYAIADPGAFIEPGRRARPRHPRARRSPCTRRTSTCRCIRRCCRRARRSLLPGEWRPAVVWTLDLDGAESSSGRNLARAQVRSVAQHTYEDVPASWRACCASSARGGWSSSEPAAA